MLETVTIRIRAYDDRVSEEYVLKHMARQTRTKVAVVIYFAAPSYSPDQKTVVIAPNRDGGWAGSLMGRF